MRFIAIDRPAAEEIIADRTLQATIFENGRALSEILRDDTLVADLSVKWKMLRHGGGIFLVSALEQSNQYIVFDVETCDLFNPTQTPEESLLYFQKSLRFAVKIWNGLRLSITEHPIQNSSKAIIFPNPISKANDFRICIELTPDENRQSKRPENGRSMLVYRSGLDEGEGRREEASSTNFRKFLEARKTLPASSNTIGTVSLGIAALQVTSLEAQPQTVISPYQGYERWLALLTKAQKNFVLGQLNAPHRIEGPAGTGKSLSLVLKCITGAISARDATLEHRAIFITHSDATRRAIELLFESNDSLGFLKGTPLRELQTIKLTTLQQLCASLLNKEISESEFIDRDAMESKQLQILYVSEALASAKSEVYSTYRKMLSPAFRDYLEGTELWAIAEMIQHEISVVIKGRAQEQIETYRKLPRLKYGLPAETSDDRGYIWEIFKRYQKQLQLTAQFDTDDIVLSTIGQLDTPLWRRRRAKEGYDAIYIDETHLFNVNELSLFHYLTRNDERHPIAYSTDRSQAIGDRDWSDSLFDTTFASGSSTIEGSSATRVDAVFRCSPEIVNLAFSVTSSGATLFTNFDDPLKKASSVFTASEERKCERPTAHSYATDEDLIIAAFQRADSVANDTESSRGDVAIIMFSDELFREAQQYAARMNKPVEIVDRRGDLDAVQRAERNGRFVLSTPEYVGGLEFSGVILVGVDDGRVPPARGFQTGDSSNFLTYAAHNRLYVAITRAKYRVEVLFAKDRGISPLFKNAIASRALKTDSSSS